MSRCPHVPGASYTQQAEQRRLQPLGACILVGGPGTNKSAHKRILTHLARAKKTEEGREGQNSKGALLLMGCQRSLSKEHSSVRAKKAGLAVRIPTSPCGSFTTSQKKDAPSPGSPSPKQAHMVRRPYFSPCLPPMVGLPCAVPNLHDAAQCTSVWFLHSPHLWT